MSLTRSFHSSKDVCYRVCGNLIGMEVGERHSREINIMSRWAGKKRTPLLLLTVVSDVTRALASNAEVVKHEKRDLDRTQMSGYSEVLSRS